MALLNFSNSDNENEKVCLLVYHQWLIFFLSSMKISNEICFTKRRVWNLNFLDMLFTCTVCSFVWSPKLSVSSEFVINSSACVSCRDSFDFACPCDWQMNERSLPAMKYKLDLMNFVTLSINETMWLIPIHEEGSISYFDAVLFCSLIAVCIAIERSDRQVWSNWELYKGLSVTAGRYDWCVRCML